MAKSITLCDYVYLSLAVVVQYYIPDMGENGSQCIWRTPDGIMRRISMRKRQRRRQSLTTLCSNTSQRIATPVNFLCSDPTKSVRPNPFAMKRPVSSGSGVSKKRIVSFSDFKDYCQHDSFSNSEVNKEKRSETPDNLPVVYLEEDSIQGIFTQVSGETSVTSHEPVGEKSLPLDWTLKRKARFLSSTSFAWCSRTKGAEDASAVARATRCIHEEIDLRPNSSEPSENMERSWRIELNKLLTYWQQPSIPWLNLFPRFGQSTKIHSGTTPALPSGDHITNAMHDCWAMSFRSVLQHTRECLCPYFYVCGQQYTALFRASTISGQNDITCTVTPTTVGLRQLLKSEGIEFSHPYSDKVNQDKQRVKAEHLEASSNEFSGDLNEKETEELQDATPADDDSTWDLINQSIKLNGPKEVARNLHAETSTSDTIFVKGNTNIQLLSNYLLNSKNSITKSGNQANIPPTILAPIAFEGATLKKLLARSGIARSCSDSTRNSTKLFGTNSKGKQYSLDIVGPLLPHCLLGLHELLEKTQGSLGYKAALSTSLYTVPFNTPENLNKDSVASKVKPKFGLPQTVSESLQRHIQDSKPICLNQVVLKNGLYTWNE